MPIAERIQKGFSEDNLSFIIKTGTGILGFFLAAVIVSRVVYPFDTGHLEAFNWMPATHLLEGKNPYAFAFTPPYSMTPYGIVYYALLAVGIKIFGLQLWWGRILSVLAFAVCVWAIIKITKELTGSKEAAWAAGLVSLALFPAQSWVAAMRSDLVALAFIFAAVALVFTTGKDAPLGFGRLTAVILLSVAAFFTKHTFLLPIVIIVLRLLQLKKWRETAIFCAAFGALTAAGMFFLNYTSGGGYFWQHFIHAQRLPFSWEQLSEGILQMIIEPTTVIFIGFLLIFAYRKRDFFAVKNRAALINLLNSPKLLIVVYLFLSFTSATVSSGRVGANINYYLESSFVIAIVSGLIFEDFRRKASPKLAFAMIFLMTFGGIFQLVRVGRGEYFRWQARAYYREISDTAATLAPAGNTCVSVFAELVARGGCAFYFDDYGEYIGDWSPELRAVFESEVRAGRFAVIVWKKNNLQEEFPNYKLVPMSQNAPERFFPVYLYVPKTGAAQ